MSQKEGLTNIDKNQLNKTKKNQHKKSLIDLVNKKLYYSKKLLLGFFNGKPFYITLFTIILYCINRLYYFI